MSEEELLEFELEQSPQEVADRLRELADTFENDDELTISDDAVSITVPTPTEHLEFETELERERYEGGNEFELEIELEWTVETDGSPVESDEIEEETDEE
ncbi:amphi-Trp domain-containing protein [Natronobacterium texcoconense]|uniref:Amphi-Trp domain-containing protein n=1 Tax=Natronobacterium texcoconense TaxID=1095778 RepID=A0A1H1A528_NATTX|nr:amphi-Trp domain-containing protein [Natronobacterium texcoconense]SDQ34720.1 amphi-Trp domain-containing protein [Natronobacterium texcoconense]